MNRQPCRFCARLCIERKARWFLVSPPLVWLGAFFWIAAPTFYVAQLLKQKLVAVQAAEEARVQAERAQADAERARVERARAEAERARAEAEAASEAKSDFLATMSHVMRTPMNGVVGAAEMLGAANLPQKERQLVDWLLASPDSCAPLSTICSTCERSRREISLSNRSLSISIS